MYKLTFEEKLLVVLVIVPMGIFLLSLQALADFSRWQNDKIQRLNNRYNL